MAKRYPEFILEDEKAFKGGVLSQSEMKLMKVDADLGEKQLDVETEKEEENRGSPAIESKELQVGSDPRGLTEPLNELQVGPPLSEMEKSEATKNGEVPSADG